jgi:hypothetical protein
MCLVRLRSATFWRDKEKGGETGETGEEFVFVQAPDAAFNGTELKITTAFFDNRRTLIFLI